MDRIRLAIVGCGNICQLNAPGYLEHPRCDVVALCDRDRARAELRARQWGIEPTIHEDYAELLADPARGRGRAADPDVFARRADPRRTGGRQARVVSEADRGQRGRGRSHRRCGGQGARRRSA
jgi:hypothetical protein